MSFKWVVLVSVILLNGSFLHNLFDEVVEDTLLWSDNGVKS